jgi:D,D-heptose 1,7-bisphosphate phosphatase
MIQAVILAGGQGTRLRERLGDLPKPLVDVDGKPLLEWQMEALRNFGCSEILLLVNYQAEKIRDFVQGKSFSDLDIRVVDEGIAKGTAGALIAASEFLREEFFVVYGDTLFDIDLEKFYQFHRSEPRAEGTLLLHPNDHPSDSDLVEVDELSRITQFHPYPHSPKIYLPNLVNAALYILRRDFILGLKYESGILDFGKHVFPGELLKGRYFRGYRSTEYIKDCGTPSRLDKVVADIRSGRVQARSLSRRQAAVFLDRDGTVNFDPGFCARPEDFELLPGSAHAIKKINMSNYLSVVITNQPVIARGDCSLETLGQIHAKMDTRLGEIGAYVDRTYFCPHHPDKGFPNERSELKIRCACRKPSVGMLERACEDYNIDPMKSWMIGDSTVDLELALRFGLKRVLVLTGNAGRDGKYETVPEFVFRDLGAAANYITSSYGKDREHWLEVGRSIRLGSRIIIRMGSSGEERACLAGFCWVLRETGHGVSLGADSDSSTQVMVVTEEPLPDDLPPTDFFFELCRLSTEDSSALSGAEEQTFHDNGGPLSKKWKFVLKFRS